MLIGLAGAKGAGKDTAALHLVRNYGFERVAYADKLKESAAALFGLDDQEIWNDWKNDPSVTITLKSKGGVHSKMTAREFLQRYGTAAHRDVFGEDFWTNALFMRPSELHALPPPWVRTRNIVVSDVRFRNESERVKVLGGKIIRIERPDLPVDADSHISEAPIPEEFVDATVVNASTPDVLGQLLWEVISRWRAPAYA